MYSCANLHGKKENDEEEKTYILVLFVQCTVFATHTVDRSISDFIYRVHFFHEYECVSLV